MPETNEESQLTFVEPVTSSAPADAPSASAPTTVVPTAVSDAPRNGTGESLSPPAEAALVEGGNGEGRVLARSGLRFRGREGRAEGPGQGAAQNRGERRDRRGRLKGRDHHRDGGRDHGQGGSASANGHYPEENPRDAVMREGGRRNEFDMVTLEQKNLTELREIAKGLEMPGVATFKKSDLVFKILEAQAAQSGHGFKRGILEILPDGKGFMRTEGYLPGEEDVYVSQSQIKRFNLKTGDMVAGQVRAPKDMERYWGLLRVEAVNGEPNENIKTRKEFEKLTPIFPDEKFKLETTQENITARIIDLVTPIGKGQRGLIVAPPKAGKTSLIKNVANSIMANHPDVYLIVLLIDERPEEVTDISRSVKGEVVASTFDELPDNHIRVADMVLEKAKRLVEMKRDVVILLDSITRLSRASNLVCTPSGRTMSGGLDPAAMYKPKRLFGAARNIEEGGSLTILATVLVDTGSRMDEYIFEELKGTGNLDLVLDRDLFNQRIFPSIDINKSGTRRDDLLLSKEDLAAVFHLRRTLASLDNDKAVTLLIDRLKNTKSNSDFMTIVQKSSQKQAAAQ
jgi:transcription termination factor Rho